MTTIDMRDQDAGRELQSPRSSSLLEPKVNFSTIWKKVSLINRQRLQVDLLFIPVRIFIVALYSSILTGCFQPFDTWTEKDTRRANAAWVVTAVGYFLHLYALPFVQKLSIPHHTIALLFAIFLVYSAKYDITDAPLRRVVAYHVAAEVGITPITKWAIRVMHVLPLGAINVALQQNLLRIFLWTALCSSATGWLGTWTYICTHIDVLLDTVGVPLFVALYFSLCVVSYIQKKTVQAVITRHALWTTQAEHFKQSHLAHCADNQPKELGKSDLVGNRDVVWSFDDIFFATHKMCVSCIEAGHIYVIQVLLRSIIQRHLQLTSLATSLFSSANFRSFNA